MIRKFTKKPGHFPIPMRSRLPCLFRGSIMVMAFPTMIEVVSHTRVLSFYIPTLAEGRRGSPSAYGRFRPSARLQKHSHRFLLPSTCWSTSSGAFRGQNAPPNVLTIQVLAKNRPSDKNVTHVLPLNLYCGVRAAHFPADDTESLRLHRSSVLVQNLKDCILSQTLSIINYMIACFIRLRIYSYSSASFIWIR